MKEGDKQRIEAVNENDEVVTYELVLLGIDVKRTDGPEKAASSSRSKRSKRSARSVEDAKGRTNPFARGFQSASASRRREYRVGFAHRMCERPPTAAAASLGHAYGEVAFPGWRTYVSRRPASRTAPASWPWSRGCLPASRSLPTTSTATLRGASSGMAAAGG